MKIKLNVGGIRRSIYGTDGFVATNLARDPFIRNAPTSHHIRSGRRNARRLYRIHEVLTIVLKDRRDLLLGLPAGENAEPREARRHFRRLDHGRHRLADLLDNVVRRSIRYEEPVP